MWQQIGRLVLADCQDGCGDRRSAAQQPADKIAVEADREEHASEPAQQAQRRLQLSQQHLDDGKGKDGETKRGCDATKGVYELLDILHPTAIKQEIRRAE